jgi:hypothetical protein
VVEVEFKKAFRAVVRDGFTPACDEFAATPSYVSAIPDLGVALIGG